MRKHLWLAVTMVASLTAARAGAAPAAGSAPPSPPDAATLKALSARLAPVDLTADLAGLPPGERLALVRILEAARVMDALFLRQVWAGNQATLVALAEDDTALGRARLRAFLQNKGPWLRLDDERPFLPGVGPKPPAGTFYPADATKAELDRWMAGLTPDDRAR